jgi:hypothetical protein
MMKKLRFFIRRAWRTFRAKEILPPKSKDFLTINRYLIRACADAIRYYTLVAQIGLLGLAVSLLCLVQLIFFSGQGLNVLWDIKEYPAVIASLITTGFGKIELEGKKKEFYRALYGFSKGDAAKEDLARITNKYKNWSLKEFRGRYKPDA